MMKAYYQMKKEDVLRNLGASECGWTSAEAEQRLVQTGPNALAEGEQKSVFKIFVEQFADLLVWILMIAAGISLFSGDVESAIVIFADIKCGAWYRSKRQSRKVPESTKIALFAACTCFAGWQEMCNSFYTGSSRGCFAAGGRRYGRCGCTNTVQSLVTG